MEEKLTREQAEREILELARKIHEIHKRYNPNADYLVLWTGPRMVAFNNGYKIKNSPDKDYPVDFTERM